MALLSTQVMAANGVLSAITFSATDATDGDSFVNDGQTYLLVVNTGAGPESLDVTGVAAMDSGRTETQTVTMLAGAEAWIGPFKARNWNNGLGQVDILSTSTDVEVAVLRYKLS